MISHLGDLHEGAARRPIRFGEAELCQFPDALCDEARVDGTHFCAPHLSEMRVRFGAPGAEYEQPSAVEFCAGDDEATGQAA